MEKTFWGRAKVDKAAAFLFFKQGGIVQQLMHQLKYNNVPELGVLLGEMYGKQLAQNPHYTEIDAIIPVPLHLRKYRKRGYNQSEQIAMGLSKSLNVPLYKDILQRTKYAESQVRKDRTSRYENLKASFIANTTASKIRRVILVDDTITTGATLEACVYALNHIDIQEISILGIAYTN